MVFKLDNVTNLTTARWAAAEGFDYISFNFNKADLNYIQPMLAAEICKWITGVKFVGSFLDADASSIIPDLVQLLNLDAIEVDLKTAEILSLHGSIPTILYLDKNTIQHGLEFEKFNKEIIAFSFHDNEKIPPGFPIEKAFISSKSAGDSFKGNFFGISFNSANETDPGLVDFEELENSKNYWKNWSGL